MINKELMNAIVDMVADKLVVTESDLIQEFLFSDNINELDNLKILCYTLQAEGKISIMNGEKGELILFDINQTIH